MRASSDCDADIRAARSPHAGRLHGPEHSRSARAGDRRRVGHRARDRARFRARRCARARLRRRHGGARRAGRERPRDHRAASATSRTRPPSRACSTTVAATLGGLDALVNNAGIAGPTAACEDVALADWERTLAVNLTGQFLCAQRAIPLLKASAQRQHRQSLVGGGPLRLSDAHAVRRVASGA